MKTVENWIGIALFGILGAIIWFFVLEGEFEQPFFNLTTSASTFANIAVIFCMLGVGWNLHLIFKKAP